MEEAKLKRSTAKGLFTRAANIMNSTLTVVGLSARTIDRRFDEMRMRWSNVQELHEQYISHLAEEHSEAAGKWIDELCDFFCRIEVSVDNYIEKQILQK